MTFKDDITHKPLVVSNASTAVVWGCLVLAHSQGKITDEQFMMTYAEICEVGFLPQMFGGKPVDPAHMQEWQSRKQWQ